MNRVLLWFGLLILSPLLVVCLMCFMLYEIFSDFRMDWDNYWHFGSSVLVTGLILFMLYESFKDYVSSVRQYWDNRKYKKGGFYG